MVIDNDDKKFNINVVSESGRVRTYTLNVKRVSSESIDMNVILNNMGFKYNDKYIKGINENTSVTSLINNIKHISNLASVSIRDANGHSKNSGIFKTGDKVVISNGKETKSFEILIYGDINGDGKIDKYDAANVLSYFYGYINLNKINKEAADINSDGKIDKYDAANVLSHYYGYVKIKQ